MVSLAHRLFAICLIAMALPACSPPDKTDLKSLQIPGVEPFDFRDESTLPLDLATTRLAHDFVARGAARGADGQMLAADAVTTDEALPAPWMNGWGQTGNAARGLMPTGRLFTSWFGKP